MKILLLLSVAAALSAAIDYDRYAWEFPVVTGIVGGEAERATLRAEIDRVLARGFLAPLSTQYCDQTSVGYATYTAPGRIVTTLAWAWPHLTAGQRSAVRTYLAALCSDPVHAPWAPGPLRRGQGAPREIHAMDRQWYARDDFGAKRPMVATIYGLWLYAWRSGDWALITQHYDALRSMYEQRAGGQAQFPQGNLYGSMCAHVGMARIAHHLGRTAHRDDALARLRAQLDAGLDAAAIERRCWDITPYWESPYRDLYNPDGNNVPRPNATIYRAFHFLDLSPELGRYLGDHVRTPVLAKHAAGKVSFPCWWLGKGDYFCRDWTGDEGVGLVPEVLGMMAPIERWVVGTDAATLRRQMRSCPSGIGDCYWLEALVQALEAGGTLRWHDVRTPLPPGSRAIALRLHRGAAGLADIAVFLEPTGEAAFTDVDGVAAFVGLDDAVDHHLTFLAPEVNDG